MQPHMMLFRSELVSRREPSALLSGITEEFLRLAARSGAWMAGGRRSGSHAHAERQFSDLEL